MLIGGFSLSDLLDVRGHVCLPVSHPVRLVALLASFFFLENQFFFFCWGGVRCGAPMLQSSKYHNLETIKRLLYKAQAPRRVRYGAPPPLRTGLVRRGLIFSLLAFLEFSVEGDLPLTDCIELP